MRIGRVHLEGVYKDNNTYRFDDVISDNFNHLYKTENENWLLDGKS